MDNYFKVIDGIKYDVSQSTAICVGTVENRNNSSESYKKKWFKMILSTTRYYINKSEYTIRKGINGNYFVYIIIWSKHKTYDEINKKYIDEEDFIFLDQVIFPITRDEAIQSYFNGYCFTQGRFYEYVPMTQLVSEEEAFEGIPVA